MVVSAKVETEVGRSRSVLVHRPDLELRRVTPSNMDELLFDELVWVDRAQEEHDEFVRVLRESGCEVLHLERLLTEVLSDEEVAREVVRDQVTETTAGPVLVDRARGFLLDLPVDTLVRHLIGGVSLAELDGSDSLLGRVRGPFEPLLSPLPNAVFMRDSSAWIGQGAVISPMNRLVRRREAELLRLVAAGRSNREIAEALVLSEKTVETHLTSTYGKIGADNRAAATAFAVRHGLA